MIVFASSHHLEKCQWLRPSAGFGDSLTYLFEHAVHHVSAINVQFPSNFTVVACASFVPALEPREPFDAFNVGLLHHFQFEVMMTNQQRPVLLGSVFAVEEGSELGSDFTYSQLPGSVSQLLKVP